MTDPNIIAGYPIVRGDDGQLYYVAYTDHGDEFGWLVSYIDHLRHHHAHHAHARRASHPVHHHASHHSTHHQVVALSHRRTVAPPLHHAAVAQPALQIAGNSPQEGGDTESSLWGWTTAIGEFVEGHPRAMLATQGVLDIAAGPTTMAVTVTIALALAPETGGLSLLFAVAATVYGLTRGGIQTGAGMAELATAAAGGSREELESTSEEIEHVKTVASISGFILLSTQQMRHGKMTKKDWRNAGYLSDAETFITSPKSEEAYEAATESVRIQRKIALAIKLGGYADKADQVKSYGKDFGPPWHILGKGISGSAEV